VLPASEEILQDSQKKKNLRGSFYMKSEGIWDFYKFHSQTQLYFYSSKRISCKDKKVAASLIFSRQFSLPSSTHFIYLMTHHDKTVLFIISTDVRILNNILSVLKNKIEWLILIYSSMLQQDMRKIEKDKI